MRIGTIVAQQQAIEGVTERQSQLIRSQEQLSSGRRVNRPSDDPMAAAEAERLRSRDMRIQADLRAVSFARSMLLGADNALGDATSLIQSARESLLAAANGSANAGDRREFAAQLQQVRKELLSVANRGDGSGGYVFTGQGSPTALALAGGVDGTLAPSSLQARSSLPVPVTLDSRENFTAIRGSGGSESIFAALDTAVAALANPATTSEEAARVAGTAVEAIDRAIDRFALSRTAVGERLRAIDVHEQLLESGNVDVKTRLSELVDVDMARAVSSMVQHQTAYEAAMKSYAQIARMKLFDYL